VPAGGDPFPVPWRLMNDQLEAPAPTDAVIAEALAVIDQALRQMVSRELVSSDEVADLLLDVRTALTAAPADQS
jgi:hypothetical protein